MFSYLMNLPMVGKILGFVVIMILCVMVLFFSSCGTTRTSTKVRNNADGTTTTITSTTNGSETATQVNVVPAFSLDSLASFFTKFNKSKNETNN